MDTCLTLKESQELQMQVSITDSGKSPCVPARHANVIQQRKILQRKSLACYSFMHMASIGLPTLTSGWVLAASILAAVRLARKVIEDDSVTRVQNAALHGWKDDQRVLLLRKEQEKIRSKKSSSAAQQRLEEARQKAAKQQEELRAENQRIMEAAARRRQQEEDAQSAERRKFEAEEAAVKAELSARAEAERKLRAERQVEAQRREEDRKRQEALERNRVQAEKEEIEKLRLAEEEKQNELKLAERRAVQQLARKFALSVEGSVSISTPPEGTQTAGPIPLVAILQMDIAASTLLGGSPDHTPVAFRSTAEARKAAPSLLVSASVRAAEMFAANARLQNMLGEGPLTVMSETELIHWMRCAGVRTAATALPPLSELLDKFGEQRASMTHMFQVRAIRGILPDGDTRQTTAKLKKAMLAVEADNLVEARGILEDFIEIEQDLISQDVPSSVRLKEVGTSLALAFFLDLMEIEWSSKTGEVSSQLEAATKLILKILSSQLQGAAQDTLQVAAKLTLASLPKGHVVAEHFEMLSEANKSSRTKAIERREEDLVKAELAKKLVAMEIPDRLQRTSLKLKQAEASVPIPERVWALRNVGETSAMGGKEGRARARTLLERAVQLKQEFVGSSKHPGMLPELKSLARVLHMEAEWEDEALNLQLLMLDIFSDIGEAYIKAGDTSSGIMLLEAVSKELEATIGMRHPRLVALNKRAYGLFQTLPSDERSKVKAARQQGNIAQQIVNAFEEDLISRQTKASQYRFESWNTNGVAWLQKLLA